MSDWCKIQDSTDVNVHQIINTDTQGRSCLSMRQCNKPKMKAGEIQSLWISKISRLTWLLQRSYLQIQTSYACKNIGYSNFSQTTMYSILCISHLSNGKAVDTSDSIPPTQVPRGYAGAAILYNKQPKWPNSLMEVTGLLPWNSPWHHHYALSLCICHHVVNQLNKNLRKL